MTQTLPTAEPGAHSGIVAVTVAGGDRRVDLALPGRLPVAELVPELCRMLGMLDPAASYAGYRLLSHDGRTLSEGAGLTAQGIEDGSVLTLSAGIDDTSPRVYDDVVEAMADAVEADMQPWDPTSSRRTALATGALLLAIGALALACHRPAPIAGAAAGVGALVLIAAAALLARVRSEPVPALVLAWVAVGYGAVAGWTAAPDKPLLGLPVALGGVGALIAAVIGAAALTERRLVLLPGVVVGLIAAVSGGIVLASDFRGESVHTVAMVLVVIAGSAVPWLAVGTTGTRVTQAHTVGDLTADPAEIDASRVRRDARSGHQVVLAIAVTVGLVIVLAAPLAVHLGIAGTIVAVLASCVLMLRTRQYRVGSEVAAGLIAGVAGFASIAASVIVEHSSWRPVLAVVLAVACAVLLALTLAQPSSSMRRGRLADAVELTGLVAMLPLLVFAIGLVGAIRS